jgi:hypothetical protein
MPAISRPMYPPPTTSTRGGNAGSRNTSSDTIASSLPGNSGRTGRPPVASSTYRARRNTTEPSASTTFTRCGPSSAARPRRISTPRPSKSRW